MNDAPTAKSSTTINSGTETGPGAVATGARTAAISTAAVAGAALAAVAISVKGHDGIARIDPRVAAEVLDIRDPVLTDLAQLLTFLGSEAIVGGVAFALMLALFARRQIVAAITLALAMAGSVTLTLALKHLVARSRPGHVDVLGRIDHSYSFPSGHTLNSATLIAVAAYLLTCRFRRPITRFVIILGAAMLETGIGLSRIYLGYHWATDVVASWLVALTWLAVVYLIISAIGAKAEERLSPYADRVLRR